MHINLSWRNMMQNYLNTQKSHVNDPILGRENDMAKNYAGGYVFTVTADTLLDRFLILGTCAPTYYAKARTLTTDALAQLVPIIKSNGVHVVQRIAEISTSGRAPNNDHALFLLALCMKHGDDGTRRAAYDAVGAVSRTATHHFHLAAAIDGLKGWGRGTRRAMGNWYLDKNLPSLIYQVTKYRQRDGWTHRDVLRLAHPHTQNSAQNNVFKWITKGILENGNAVELLRKFDEMQQASSEDVVIHNVEEGWVSWEMIPTQFLGSKNVWEALVRNGMPMTALIRNLGRMTANGTLVFGGDLVDLVCTQLTNADYLHSARVHPYALLLALDTYGIGHGDKGKLTWGPLSRINEALNEAFFMSFEMGEPSNENIMIGIDVSGSMDWSVSHIAGTHITSRMAAATMAMATARTHKNCMAVAFTGNLTDIDLGSHRSVHDVCNQMARMNAGTTNCSLPMTHALQHKFGFDKFIIYTDNETHHHAIHPAVALDMYCKGVRPAKLVVAAFVGSRFSIADPKRSDMLDVVGFDSAAPRIITEF